MAVYLYVIVPAEVAKKLGRDAVRQKLSNGCYLLNQDDFSSEPESTLYGRVAKYNGAIITEAEAMLILSGKKEPPVMEQSECDKAEDTSETDDMGEEIETDSEEHQETPEAENEEEGGEE